MTKVNMDVMRPWITRKVTELLGFEDEVLINFIHGLLDSRESWESEREIWNLGFETDWFGTLCCSRFWISGRTPIVFFIFAMP